MSNSTTPTVSIETITPEQAAELLRSNEGNRKINIDRVIRYANAMRDGKWRVTGESITLASNGQIVNGQHRLAACVHAEVPFQSSVMRGVDPEVFPVIDTGMNRTPGHVLAHGGVTYATNTAAAARLALAYRTESIGQPRLMARALNHEAILNETLGNIDRYKKLGQDAFRAYRTGFNTSAYMAFGILLGEQIGTEAADSWMYQAASGADLTAGDPRLALRNWQRTARRRQATFELSAWIRAWNAFAVGETRNIIRPWASGQPYPRIAEISVPEEVSA
jgi:hypothetical protein